MPVVRARYLVLGIPARLLHNAPGKRDVAKRRKPKPFRAVKAVKAAAREKIGTPPPTRRVPVVMKETRQKHKPTLGKLLENES
jgi:hypothetical protein